MREIRNILLIKTLYWLYNHFYIIVTCHKNNFLLIFLHVERKKMMPSRIRGLLEKVIIAAVQAHSARLTNIVLSLISLWTLGGMRLS